MASQYPNQQPPHGGPQGSNQYPPQQQGLYAAPPPGSPYAPSSPGQPSPHAPPPGPQGQFLQPQYGGYPTQTGPPHGGPHHQFPYQQPPSPQPQYGYAPQPGAPYATAPSPGQYTAPHPQSQYQQPPSPQPHSGGYGTPHPPPGHGYPPYGPTISPGGFPPPNQPPPGPYGHPPQGQGPPVYAQPGGLTSPNALVPSRGYNPSEKALGNFELQAKALRKAMKGMGTNNKELIQQLKGLDPLQAVAVRNTYTTHIGRDLIKDVKSETSGYFEDGLVAVINGPLLNDVEKIDSAIKNTVSKDSSIGLKEWLLIDALLGRSNADINAIKTAYHSRFKRSLDSDISSHVHFKIVYLYNAAIRAERHDDSQPINPQSILKDVSCLHEAKDVKEACLIFTRSSNAEIWEINRIFHQYHNKTLETHIEEKFGDRSEPLLYMLRTATNPAMRDAILLEESMTGMGTKDERLVARVVRVHWDRNHKAAVKSAYHEKYFHKIGENLQDRIRGETSGNYQRLMVELLA